MNERFERIVSLARGKELSRDELIRLADLSEFESAQERESLRRLRQEVFGEDGSRGRRRVIISWAGLAAAAAAFLLFLPRGDGLDAVHLVVEPPAGVQRSAEIAREDGVVRAGDSVFLDFELERELPLVVVYLAADGSASILVPREGNEPARLGPGEIRLPSEESGVRWVMDDEVGTESFYVIEVEDAAALVALRESLSEALDAEARRILLEKQDVLERIQFEHLR